MNNALKQSHVWKNYSEMGYDGFKYNCSRVYAHDLNRNSSES